MSLLKIFMQRPRVVQIVLERAKEAVTQLQTQDIPRIQNTLNEMRAAMPKPQEPEKLGGPQYIV